MIALCDFLVADYKRAGKFESNVHTHASCVLALMASGDKKYESLIRDIMSDYGKKRYDSTKSDGFPVWGQVHDGILMGEYYLLKKDRSLLPAMESLQDCLNDCVWPETGGLSHKPFAGIQRRMAEGGPKGYGAMALPGGLGMLALSLFKEAGLPHAAPSYERIHEAFLASVGSNGSIGYGFNIWDHAVIELADPKGAPKNSPRGIGFECVEGLKGIGDYKIEWPTKSDPRYRPTDWLDKELATNRVFDMGKGKRMVVRNMSPDEPTKPFKQDGGQCDHFARSGVGALAHAIGNSDNKSWGYLSDLMAEGCAKSGKGLLDGHASTHMHVLWGSLGAGMADEKDFREYMDAIKWWFIMAQTHDGSFVVMPGRDYASTDHVYGTRDFPTACAALILSLKEKRLQITGAPRHGGAGGSVEKAEKPTARPARQLSGDKKAMLDELLGTALAELNHSGQLSPLPMGLSKATTKVWLAAVEKDSRLTFRAMQGESKATFSFAELTAADHALLACLVARLRLTDSEAQVMAGIYSELTGDTTLADIYYAKSGEGFAGKIEELFK